MFREDWLERVIQEIADLLAGALDLAHRGEHEAALEQIERGYARLLGPQRELLGLVDGASLATLLGDAEKTRALARLLQAEATVHQARGDARAARRAEALAEGLSAAASHVA
ncbi:MAG: hypothetical protein D6729_06820 [Deltaproteobacteria bacterium]|nr:MAG: hypothetical protein D6729_06820 [Deltaproteobacteria bacterium]